MKPVVFRYGIYAVLAILLFSSIHFFVLMPRISYEEAEIAGYLTMILSMIFVFMGIRYYRDHVNKGSLTFREGLKVGVLIVLMPAVFFGLFDILYTNVLNPAWADEYFGHYVDKIKATSAPDQIEAKLEKLQKQKEFFGQPILQFLVMAATVFVIGFIATIISTLTLTRKKETANAKVNY